MPEKKWQKPKLVVLVRGKPEERILTGCKTSPPAGGPDSTNGCDEFQAPSCTNPCYDGSS